MEFIDIVTFLAFGAYTIELIVQMFHLRKRKSSQDISLRACLVRMSAGLVVLIKYVLIKEWVLIIGQGFFNIIYLYFVFMVLYYRNKLFFLLKPTSDVIC